MQIQISDEASRTLAILRPSSDYALQLVYDTEGCGCGVEGVARLRFVVSADGKTEPLASNLPFPVLINRQEAIFFEDSLVLDYFPDRKAFKLSGPGQIYAANLVID